MLISGVPAWRRIVDPESACTLSLISSHHLMEVNELVEMTGVLKTPFHDNKRNISCCRVFFENALLKHT